MNGLDWIAFEAMLETSVPAVKEALRPPATLDAIRDAERAMAGIVLPAAVKRAYLTHDGTTPERSAVSPATYLFFPFNCWASLDAMVEEWSNRRSMALELDQNDHYLFPAPDSSWDRLKIKPVWWSERWIPIGLSNTATTVFVDLDPAPSGAVGQLIHHPGGGDIEVIASSLDEYFETLRARVEAGLLTYDSGWVARGADCAGAFFWTDVS